MAEGSFRRTDHMSPQMQTLLRVPGQKDRTSGTNYRKVAATALDFLVKRKERACVTNILKCQEIRSHLVDFNKPSS